MLRGHGVHAVVLHRWGGGHHWSDYSLSGRCLAVSGHVEAAPSLRGGVHVGDPRHDLGGGGHGEAGHSPGLGGGGTLAGHSLGGGLVIEVGEHPD